MLYEKTYALFNGYDNHVIVMHFKTGKNGKPYEGVYLRIRG